MNNCVNRGQPVKWMLACLLLLSARASASVPYDKFCDQDGNVTNDREVLAMLARPGELDAIYEDALRGDVRATRFLRTLEVTFEESARVVAENVSSPECAVAPFLPKCRADWRILAPLRDQGRGAARLLEVTQDAYEQRLRELAPQRRLNEAALTMLMTVGPLLAKRPAAKSAGAEVRGMGKPAETRPTAPAPSAARGTAAIIEEGKFGYFFGRASGRAHNVERAAENAAQLRRIGVHDTAEGRALLQGHFDKVVGDPSNVTRTFSNQYGSFEIRESLFAGPGGFVKFESTWQVIEGGGRRLTTAIPFGGP